MEKWEKNHLFWKFLRGGTSTKQSGTGTIGVLSTVTGTGTGTQCFVLDQCYYFSHNLLTSYPV